MTFLRSNAIAMLALFVALGGTGYAAHKVTGKDIAKSTITSRNLRDGSIQPADLSSALRRKLKLVPITSKCTNCSGSGLGSIGASGAQGSPGATGASGAAGAKGETGSSGNNDFSAKTLTVDHPDVYVLDCPTGYSGVLGVTSPATPVIQITPTETGVSFDTTVNGIYPLKLTAVCVAKGGG